MSPPSQPPTPEERAKAVLADKTPYIVRAGDPVPHMQHWLTPHLERQVAKGIREAVAAENERGVREAEGPTAHLIAAASETARRLAEVESQRAELLRVVREAIIDLEDESAWGPDAEGIRQRLLAAIARADGWEPGGGA